MAIEPRILDEMLRRVQKPARYMGEEVNQVVKDHDAVDVRLLLAFPDVYEVGMSHLGSHILYEVVNSRADALMERVYAPWDDMEQQLKDAGQPLFSLETKTPLNEFDLVGFTLQYELTYTNILNMLALGDIPIRAAAREESDPFVMVGGPCAFNPEPLAPFVDFVVLGEGEEVLGDIIDAFKMWKMQSAGRIEFLNKVSKIPGIYVPSLYHVSYGDDGAISAVEPLKKTVPPRVTKRIVADLDVAQFSIRPIVPYIDTVHDRGVLELFRGCARGCRFCQAGMIYRPVRERSKEALIDQAHNLLAFTGYDELSLSSLSSMDYSEIVELIDGLAGVCSASGVRLSLPSLRVDSVSVQQAQKIHQVRRSSITMAPEAGSQRLRDVINKNVNENELFEAVTLAVKAGWRAFKLYFMIGLPTETDEDVLAIADLARRIADLKLSEGSINRVTVSTANFVPKPHTPFQWEAQVPRAELHRRQLLLNNALKGRKLEHRWHDPENSFLEAVFSRGDRKVAAALERAWQLGARLDGWSEFFKPNIWADAFVQVGLDPAFYANREWPLDGILPWGHLQSGVSQEFLINERNRAFEADTTDDCSFEDCIDCGVCPMLGVPIRRRGDPK